MASTVTPESGPATIPLEQQVVRLQALLEASRQIHAAVRLEDAMRVALRIAVRELELTGAFFTDPPLSYGEVPAERGGALHAGWVRFPLYDKSGRLLTDLVVIPALGQPLGLYEEDFLQGLVLQAAIAIENAHFHERNVAWARVEQDLAAARAIQRSLLPEALPHLPGYGAAVRSSPCYEVGGDYADILALPTGERVMIVADVAGKGLASAIMSMAFRSAFRALAVSGLPLEKIAERLNQEHWSEGIEARRRFVTAILLKLNVRNHGVEVVNAGHSPGFLVDGSGARLIESSGPPLGLFPGIHYSSERYELIPGSRLLLYTDGLTDVFRSEDDEFGQQRLLNEFINSRETDCPGILDRLWSKVTEFSGGSEQQDDMTALVLCREPGERS